MTNEPASWIIREKATGRVLFETFSKKTADAINTKKYEVIGIGKYLASINGSKS